MKKETRAILLEKFGSEYAEEKDFAKDYELCLGACVEAAVNGGVEGATYDEGVEDFLDEQFDQLQEYLKSVSLDDLMCENSDDFGGVVSPGVSCDDVQVVDRIFPPIGGRYDFLL